MPTTIKTSIAMATYNGANYIKDQLESFKKQTLLADELIICDDGSKDNTIKIIKSFQKHSPFDVKLYINNKRLGYGQNFGKALSLCSGDLIFLSDQDDVWFKNKIDEMVNIVKHTPDKYFFMNDTILTDENLKPSKITKLRQIKAVKNNIKSFVQGSCSAVKKDFLQLALPIPVDYKSHDNWLSELAIVLDLKFIYPVPLQFYRIHANNTGKLYLNTPKKIYFYHKFINRLKKKTSISLDRKFEQEQDRLYEIIERISSKEMIDKNPYLNKNLIGKVMIRIRNNLKAIRERKKLHKKPRRKRVLLAIGLWMKGNYNNYFNGNYSFIRDIFFK